VEGWGLSDRRRRQSAGGGRESLRPSPARFAAAPRLAQGPEAASLELGGPGGSAGGVELCPGPAVGPRCSQTGTNVDLVGFPLQFVGDQASRFAQAAEAWSAAAPPEVSVSPVAGSFSEEPSQPLPQAIKDPGPTRTFTAVPRAAESTDIPPYVMKCPSNGLCSRLPADCIDCKTNFSCVYGKPVTFDCTVKPSVTCVLSEHLLQSPVPGGSPTPAECDQDPDFKSQKSFVLNMTCRFCWQLPEADYECVSSSNCRAVSCPRQRYATNCTVRDHIHCLGNRTFLKMVYCNWTGGYKWSTALALR
uniref:TM2 domain containing 3 n=1 Tax=Capra hircus TaxID=9925 RepID=A0A8C2SII6_CAPHI